MSEAIGIIEGRAIPLGLANVDTDTIIPARHLRTVSREGLGRFAFEPLRAEAGNLLDDLAFDGAPILIAGGNFGCGSSREHAVWAMRDMGLRAVIAPGFSDIFAGNAFKNGLLCAEIAEEALAGLLGAARDGPVRIDLEQLAISAAGGATVPFRIDPFRRDCLLKGLGEIGLTLALDEEISAYERRSPFGAKPRPGLPLAVPNRLLHTLSE